MSFFVKITEDKNYIAYEWRIWNILLISSILILAFVFLAFDAPINSPIYQLFIILIVLVLFLIFGGRDLIVMMKTYRQKERIVERGTLGLPKIKVKK